MGKQISGPKTWRALIACAILLCGAGACETASQPTALSQGYLSTGRSHNSAMAEAAGEFRVVAANLLWARVVDHYHHQYLAEGGDWSRNVSLLPLLHTIVMLDPHFTEAYELMGGTILPRTGREAEGKAVLAEGIRSNPNEWELYREIAVLYGWNDHQPAAALPYARQGLAQASRVTDDDGFSRRLMTKMCTALQQQVHDLDAKQSAGPAQGSS